MLYMKNYKKYIEWQSQEKMNSTGQASITDETIEHIPEDVQTALCVGVGDGYEMLRFADRGIETVGITLNMDAIIYPKLNILQCDMHDMPFDNFSFDLTFVKDVFEHAYSHWELLLEIKRVSKKYVLIILPDPNFWSNGLYHTIVPYSNQMNALAIKVGIENIKAWTHKEIGHHMLFCNLYQVNKLFPKETKKLPWDLCLISDEEIKQLYNVDDIEKWKQYVIENT